MQPLTETFKMYDMATRTAVEHHALAIIVDSRFNEEEAIDRAREDVDRLWDEWLTNASVRVNEEGECSYCGGELPQGTPDVAVTPCDILGEDLNTATLILDFVRYRFAFVRMMANPKANLAHLTHVSMMVQNTGDWTGGYGTLLELQNHWENDDTYQEAACGTAFRYIPSEMLQLADDNEQEMEALRELWRALKENSELGELFRDRDSEDEDD